MDGIQCRVCWRVVPKSEGIVCPDEWFMCVPCRNIKNQEVRDAYLDRIPPEVCEMFGDYVKEIVVPKHAAEAVAKAFAEGRDIGIEEIPSPNPATSGSAWNGKSEWNDADPVTSGFHAIFEAMCSRQPPSKSTVEKIAAMIPAPPAFIRGMIPKA